MCCVLTSPRGPVGIAGKFIDRMSTAPQKASPWLGFLFFDAVSGLRFLLAFMISRTDAACEVCELER
jgi:hypothetical protein